jgi:hypothetical protein
MFYKMLADLVVLTHLAFIVFALFGGLLALRWRWMPWVHLPAVAWGASVSFFGWFCPLTPLENALRRASGSPGYAGDFVEVYIVPIIYPTALTREIQGLLGLGVLTVNLGIYLVVSWRLRKGSERQSADPL